MKGYQIKGEANDHGVSGKDNACGAYALVGILKNDGNLAANSLQDQVLNKMLGTPPKDNLGESNNDETRQKNIRTFLTQIIKCQEAYLESLEDEGEKQKVKVGIERFKELLLQQGLTTYFTEIVNSYRSQDPSPEAVRLFTALAILEGKGGAKEISPDLQYSVARAATSLCMLENGDIKFACDGLRINCFNENDLSLPWSIEEYFFNRILII
jgi:hypothetical protein